MTALTAMFQTEDAPKAGVLEERKYVAKPQPVCPGQVAWVRSRLWQLEDPGILELFVTAT